MADFSVASPRPSQQTCALCCSAELTSHCDSMHGGEVNAGAEYFTPFPLPMFTV